MYVKCCDTMNATLHYNVFKRTFFTDFITLMSLNFTPIFFYAVDNIKVPLVAAV